MKFLFSLFLIIASLLGIIVCFMSSIVVESSLPMINGWELSVTLGVFCLLALINGLYNMFSTS
jgi:DMSO reductase anchor subunit